MDNDEILIGRLLNHDQSALEQLYGRYAPLLYAVARRITGDAGAAEEIIQDTFFQLWKKASLFDSVRGSLIGWLLAITRNRSLSQLRKSQHASEDSVFDETIAPMLIEGSGNLEQQIAEELITVAMAGLSEVQREAITLAYFDGLTSEEIAVCTSTPVGTAKTRLRNALTSMRKDLSRPISQKPASPGKSCSLDDIIITDELISRVRREPNAEREKKSLRQLSNVVSGAPQKLIDCFLQMALDLCRAGTAGLSILENKDTQDGAFRWTNLAGILKKHVGGTTPRNFSPCGVTLDRHSPQLFKYPGRYFHYFNNVECPIVEGLVLPFEAGGGTKGTIWIVSHEEKIRFDREDVRIMTALTQFVGSAFHLIEFAT